MINTKSKSNANAMPISPEAPEEKTSGGTRTTSPSPSHRVCECDIQPGDIKLGRGGPLIRHPGNVWFRNLVAKHFDAFENVAFKGGKTLLCKKILEHIRLEDRKIWKALPNQRKFWVGVGDEEALKKVAFTFRTERRNFRTEHRNPTATRISSPYHRVCECNSTTSTSTSPARRVRECNIRPGDTKPGRDSPSTPDDAQALKKASFTFHSKRQNRERKKEQQQREDQTILTALPSTTNQRKCWGGVDDARAVKKVAYTVRTECRNRERKKEEEQEQARRMIQIIDRELRRQQLQEHKNAAILNSVLYFLKVPNGAFWY